MLGCLPLTVLLTLMRMAPRGEIIGNGIRTQFSEYASCMFCLENYVLLATVIIQNHKTQIYNKNNAFFHHKPLT